MSAGRAGRSAGYSTTTRKRRHAKPTPTENLRLVRRPVGYQKPPSADMLSKVQRTTEGAGARAHPGRVRSRLPPGNRRLGPAHVRAREYDRRSPSGAPWDQGPERHVSLRDSQPRRREAQSARSVERLMEGRRRLIRRTAPEGRSPSGQASPLLCMRSNRRSLRVGKPNRQLRRPERLRAYVRAVPSQV